MKFGNTVLLLEETFEVEIFISKKFLEEISGFLFLC